MSERHPNTSLWTFRPSVLAGISFLLFCCLASPIWLNAHVPLVDYPAHLARSEILFLYDRVPSFHDTYVIDSRLLPNLAMDLVTPLLRNFFPLEVSGKVFLTAIMALYCAGTLALSKVLFGRVALRTFLLWPMFYNSALLWGFINYVAGVCIFVAWTALLLRTSESSAKDARPEWQTLRYFLLIVGAFACYVAHLSAFIMCGIAWTLLVVRELVLEKRVSRQLLLCGLALPLPVIHYASLLLSSHYGAGPQIAGLRFDWLRKLVQLGSFSRGYDWREDLLPTALLLGVGLYCLARSWRELLVSRAAWIAAGLFAAFLLLPRDVNVSTASGFDVRFFWPAVAFLVMALPAYVWSSRERLALACLVVSAWAIRLGYLESNWRELSDESSRLLAVLDKVPVGSPVYPLCGAFAASDAGKTNAALCHVVSYGIARRHLIDRSFFSKAGAEPVLFRSTARYSGQGSITEIGKDDYVWSSANRGDATTFLTDRADRIGETDGYSLWRNVRGDRTLAGGSVPPGGRDVSIRRAPASF
jgi:hypothetical protein